MMSPRYLWKVFEAGKLKMLVSGRGRRGKLQACPFLTLSFRPEFHHRIRPCIIWSYLIHWRWQEFGRNILCWWFSWWSLEVRPREFVDDDDFLGDCLKWGQGYLLMMMIFLVIASSEAKGAMSAPKLGTIALQTHSDPIPCEIAFRTISAQNVKDILNTRLQHQETGKRGKMSSNPLRHLKRALSLKIEPIAALVLVWWPFSGLCVPIVDPKVKEDRVEALQNFFQVQIISNTRIIFIPLKILHITVNIIIFTSLPTLFRNTGTGRRTTGMLPSSSSVSSSTWSMWLVRYKIFLLQINCVVCWALEKFLTPYRQYTFQIYFVDLFLGGEFTTYGSDVGIIITKIIITITTFLIITSSWHQQWVAIS